MLETILIRPLRYLSAVTPGAVTNVPEGILAVFYWNNMESTPKKRKNKDLWCENCSQRESTTLLYYEKYHLESGRTSLINPSLICDNCKPLFLNCNILLENRPRLVPFEVLAKWDNRLMGLTSKSRWEFSCFRSPYFRKKLFRIRFIWKENEPERRS